MKLFIDTGSVAEVEEIARWGVLAGATTNPSLLAKEDGDPGEIIRRIAELVDGPTSAEVVGDEPDGMVAEGVALAGLDPRVVVKVPFSAAGLEATARLHALGHKVNMTLVFSAPQAILAAEAGATYISAFLGRLDDIGIDSTESLREIIEAVTTNSTGAQVLAASIRNPIHATISATLGTSQLQSGLLAGLIGLILVVIYSLFQYRGLASVTIGSLVIAATLTYLILCLVSWRIGYRLSLAGVAGIIVAIGITADSFIVYFERIRDELRDGRGLEGAVEAGWRRALRTIIASDTVNFLAAVTLFLLTIGNVRGFAFTLGLTTIIDIVVVTLFTHPIMQLIARTKFFGGGHPLSGLDPKALGAVYRGRAQFRGPQAEVSAVKLQSSGREAARRQTIAERKAAEANAKTGKDS